MAVRLIAADMDGTMLRDDHVTISERNLHAVRESIQRGIWFVPATGRMLGLVPQSLTAIPGVRYAITSNGAAVYDLSTKERLFYTPLEKADVLEILARIGEEDHLLEMYFNGQSYIGKAGIRYLQTHTFPEDLNLFIKKKRTVVESLSQFVQQEGVEIEKINFPYLVRGERETLWPLLERIPRLMITSSGFNNLEINHCDATKGAALQALCGFLHIDLADTVVFGDGQNDREMIHKAGTGVAMKNALPEILRTADAVTLSNEEDGVAAFLEENVFL